MVDWYVSSTAYAAVPAFIASHAYTVGNIIRPTAAAVGAQYCQRCTTAGTSSTEPAWTNNPSGTTTTGGATFTNVAGNPTYNWSAPIGNLYSLSTGSAGSFGTSAGDRVFVSSDHSEVAGNLTFSSSNSSGAVKFISVNKAGSVPPVSGDITSGATITCSSSNIIIDMPGYMYWQGFIFVQSAASHILFANSGGKAHYYKNCAFSFTTTNASSRLSNNNPVKVTLDNTTVQFGATGQAIASNYALEINWINTPSAIPGSIFPTTLFSYGGNGPSLFTCRGLDLSAITGTLVVTGVAAGGIKMLIEGCKIASGVTRVATPTSNTLGIEETELVNCFDGTKILSERYNASGAVITDRTTYMTGGAADDTGGFALKMVSNTNPDLYAQPLESFWFDVENTLTGAAHTATIQIVGSASLNNTDIHMVLEYCGAVGSSVVSFIDSLPTPLTASAALSASSSTWNSPPGTPVYQYLQVTFTPQTAGRVRAKVMLAKASMTIWVNPQILIA